MFSKYEAKFIQIEPPLPGCLECVSECENGGAFVFQKTLDLCSSTADLVVPLSFRCLCYRRLLGRFSDWESPEGGRFGWRLRRGGAAAFWPPFSGAARQ